MYLTRNQAYGNPVPRVRIPPSPPNKIRPLWAFFIWLSGIVDETSGFDNTLLRSLLRCRLTVSLRTLSAQARPQPSASSARAGRPQGGSEPWRGTRLSRMQRESRAIPLSLRQTRSRPSWAVFYLLDTHCLDGSPRFGRQILNEYSLPFLSDRNRAFARMVTSLHGRKISMLAFRIDS